MGRARSFLRHPWVTRSLNALALIPVVLILAVFQLNYSGVCLGERRVLSDQELIEIAIRRTVNGRPESTPAEPVDDCCDVGFSGYKGIPISLWQRITGFGRAYVSVKFNVTVDTPNGGRRQMQRMAYWRMTNCGYATVKP